MIFSSSSGIQQRPLPKTSSRSCPLASVVGFGYQQPFHRRRTGIIVSDTLFNNSIGRIHENTVCPLPRVCGGGRRRVGGLLSPGVSTMDGPTRVYAAAATSSSIPETSSSSMTDTSGTSSSSSPGTSVVVVDIAQEEEFDAVVAGHPGALVVLMCKAKGCRPCKQFKSKYDTLAKYFTDAVFCEVIGDRNESTRNMMRKMKIRATPTFVFYRNQEKVHEHSGINPQKMIDALEAHVLEGESGYGEEHLHFVANVLSNEEDED